LLRVRYKTKTAYYQFNYTLRLSEARDTQYSSYFPNYPAIFVDFEAISIYDSSFCVIQNDEIERESFTFDKFYELYHKTCPRTDVEQLFSETWGTMHIILTSLPEFANRFPLFIRIVKMLFC